MEHIIAAKKRKKKNGPPNPPPLIWGELLKLILWIALTYWNLSGLIDDFTYYFLVCGLSWFSIWILKAYGHPMTQRLVGKPSYVEALWILLWPFSMIIEIYDGIMFFIR